MAGSFGANLLTVKPEKWLNQGDIFLEVPIPDVAEPNLAGPALLATYHCALDKRNRRGQSTVTHLNFLPVRSVAALPSDRARLLRDDPRGLTPYAALYLGEVEQIGEGYVSLAECFTLPSAEFAISIVDFKEDLNEDETDTFRAVDTLARPRVATLEKLQHELFLQKWRAHWTGVIAP